MSLYLLLLAVVLAFVVHQRMLLVYVLYMKAKLGMWRLLEVLRGAVLVRCKANSFDLKGKRVVIREFLEDGTYVGSLFLDDDLPCITIAGREYSLELYEVDASHTGSSILIGYKHFDTEKPRPKQSFASFEY